MSPVHSFASWPILRGGGCTFSQTRHGRNTAKAKSTQPTSTLTEIPPTYTQVFAHCPLKARNQRGRRRQPGEFVNLVRYLSMPHSMHTVSQPSLRAACIFSLVRTAFASLRRESVQFFAHSILPPRMRESRSRGRLSARGRDLSTGRRGSVAAAGAERTYSYKVGRKKPTCENLA
jgi:hypothetical protein